MLFDKNRRELVDLAASVVVATQSQRAELVRMLVDHAVACDGRIDPAEITWALPARPFFATRWFECPQGGSRTRPLSDDDSLAWYAA